VEHLIRVAEEVQAALEEGRAVVALETTLVAHGFPAPTGVGVGLASETAVRAAGAVPATIGVLDGRLVIGLTAEELERFTPDARKLGPRDLAPCAVQGAVGATTVGGTLTAAAAVGIRFMGTGGLGGVHRGFPTPPDVSADLGACARVPALIASSGVKSLLDVPATAEVLDGDGWLRTGDIATIDDDGFVTITDRKKDIIVTAGGKNIAPQNLENDLKTSRFVSQALVVGDRRPYPAALITLDPVEIGKWASEQGLDGDLSSLSRDPRVVELMSSVVEDVNRDRSRYEQLKRFAILERDFEMERGEVTPTLKLRRGVVLDHFAEAVEGLYDGSR